MTNLHRTEVLVAVDHAVQSHFALALMFSVGLILHTASFAQGLARAGEIYTRSDASHETAGGWEPQASTTSAPLWCVHFENPKVGWAGGLGTMLRTTDGGTTWGKIHTSDTEDMDFENPSHGIAVSGTRLRTTTDAGSQWIDWGKSS